MKKIIMITCALALALAVGFTASTSLIVIAESSSFFTEISQNQKIIDDFLSSDFMNKYVFISGILTGNEDEQALIENADEGMKSDSNYVGMLYKQQTLTALTLIPKSTEELDFREFNINSMGAVSDDYYITSSPLIVEDTYSEMDIYNELDKSIMCDTYSVYEQIPIYISRDTAEKYNLSGYAYGVGTVYDENTQEYKSITLNFKIMGIIDEPSFSTALNSSSIAWEVAIPTLDFSDTEIFSDSEKNERIFVFKAGYSTFSSETLNTIEEEISEYAVIVENSTIMSDIAAQSEYNYLSENYMRYTVEMLMAVIVLVLLSVISVILFGFIYKRLIFSEQGTSIYMTVASAVIDVLVIIAFLFVNYRIEFTDERFGTYIMPSVLNNSLILCAGIVFTAVIAVCVCGYIVIYHFCRKRKVRQE